ncbi:RNA polymerase sigma factor [Chitinophaga sp. HK235]|uniref:RNA polymerase sigma factor n=1 Tax=Chitinophaga sp. HK235 TaxID=2952571 RepID=UPI001BAADEBD|nr:RNA polymerase sigma factor [Chitinophaga sp. HK235]
MSRNDEVAFLQVFETTRDGLYRIFRKLTTDEYQVEDLVQECYLELWKKWEGLQDPVNYVFGIAYNQVKVYHRKKIRAALTMMELPEDAGNQPGLLNPDQQYQLKETQNRLQKIMQELSPEKRVAFNLIREEERSYQEASQLLGVPVSTLEKRVSGSLKVLRKMLRCFF